MHLWNLFFVAGIGIGGFLAQQTTPDDYQIDLSEKTALELMQLGISDFSGLVPSEIFDWSVIASGTGLVFILIGGFMIGFGTRYANGCTSGHTIMGLSNFKLASLIATIGFFVGGLLMTHFILPYIL